MKIISATNVHVRCTLRKPITIRNRASKIPTKRYAMQSTFLRPRKSRKLHLGSGAFYNSQVARPLSARLLCDLHCNVRSALRPSLYSPLFTLHGFKPHRLNQLGELNRRLSMVKLEVLMRLSLLRYFQQQQQHTKGGEVPCGHVANPKGFRCKGIICEPLVTMSTVHSSFQLLAGRQAGGGGFGLCRGT